MPRLLLSLLALALLAAGCGDTVGDPTVAAVVNGEEVAVAEVRPLVAGGAGAVDPATGQAPDEQQLATQALSELALLELLGQELERRGGDPVTDGQVDDLLDRAIEDAGGAEAFEQQLAAQGASRARLRLDQAFQTTVDRLIEVLSADVEVAEEDIEFAYGSRYGLPSVSHILVETEEAAQEVLDRIEAGEDFGDVAREVSQDPGSAPNGGELGPLQVGAFVPEFEEAALALEPGAVSEPVQTQFGFHVITTEAAAPLDDELRAQITDELRQQEVQGQLGGLLQRLLDEAEVDVNPRFGRWDPVFGPSGGLSQVIAATDPLGQLQPAPGLDAALDPAAGEAGEPGAPASPAPQQ